MKTLPLAVQTTYAEIVDRAIVADLQNEFPPEAGSFYKRTVRGRNYFYFQGSMREGKRIRRYIGPETPQLLDAIAKHRTAVETHRERRDMVDSILAVSGLSGPDAMTGRVLEKLARAGVFRLRAVVVGTIAYQIYAPMLGVRLGARSLMTQDLDIAQFPSISVAVDDAVDQPFLDILRSVDPAFAPVPHVTSRSRVTQFDLKGRYRVEILSPNRGPESDEPVDLPALAASGQPLRFLDFLIFQEVKAVALWDGGILVNVPAPERFACHKLIVSQVRAATSASQAKARKDIEQARHLLEVLSEQRPARLRSVWTEMLERGPGWRSRVFDAVKALPQDLQTRLAGIGLRLEK